MNIGIISDTHGYLDPRVPKLFKDVAHIIHGGDVGALSVTSQLQQIAPVTAVMGNVDKELTTLRETECVELGGRKFLVHHIVEPRDLHRELRLRIQKEKPDVVVFG